MSVCAVMLVKDEIDIIEYTVRYLLGQVDHVIVSDNGSTDGTLDVLSRLVEEYAVEADGYTSTVPARGLWLRHDPEVGYYQSEKTSRLAAEALSLGHSWVVPCDADELWYATDGRTIRDFLGGLAPDVAYVEAQLYNHLPTTEDPSAVCPVCGNTGWEELPDHDGDYPSRVPCRLGEPNPFRRIGWRQRQHGAFPKVCARTRPGLEIAQGNHSAWAPGSGVTAGGLVVRHYSWRSEEQYEKKIRNGARAYAATDLAPTTGTHWRMFGDPDAEGFNERVREHFRTWFLIDEPLRDETLIYDPAPLRDAA